LSVEQRNSVDSVEVVASWLGEFVTGRVALFAIHFVFCLALLWFHADFTPMIYTAVLDSSINRSWDEVALGIFFALMPLFWVPLRLELPSQMFAYILYLAVHVTFCTVGLQSVAVSFTVLLPYIIICALSLIAFFWLATIPPSPIRREGYPMSYVLIGLALAGIGILSWAAATVGINFEPLALEDVYDLRFALREQFAEGGTGLLVLGYLISPLTLVIAPALVIAGLRKGQRYWLFVAMAISYAGYQAFSQRIALGAGIICAIAVYTWVTERAGRISISPLRIALFFLAILVAVTILDADDPGRPLSQLTIGRLLIVPGMLGSFWIEFFSENPHGLYAGSGVLGLLFGREEPYGMPLSRLMGLVYFGSEQNNANAHLWAEGYAQAGFIGVLIASAIAMAAFRLLDRLCVDRNPRFLLPVCIPMALTLTNVHVLGLFLTSGLWLLYLIAYCMPKDSTLTSGPPS
jgi:hypothetical protein